MKLRRHRIFIKEFKKCEQIFPAEKTNEEQEAWNELQALLASRISDAENGAVSSKTFDQITDEAIRELS